MAYWNTDLAYVFSTDMEFGMEADPKHIYIFYTTLCQSENTRQKVYASEA